MHLTVEVSYIQVVTASVCFDIAFWMFWMLGTHS